MVKSVDTSKYDDQYFKERREYSAYDQLRDPNEFSHIYQKAGSMLKLEKNDKVIDLGCGSGQMAFHLYLKYGCNIAGIDYSQAAIEIGQNNLSKLSSRPEYSNIRNKVEFFHSDNDHLPEFSDIKAVFWIDVVEHLYDHEIEEALEKIKKWKRKDGMYLVVHTDNNNYQRFVRPVINFLAVIFGKTSLRELRKNKEHEMERHINLTTAYKFRKKLSANGFKVLKISYPPMEIGIIKAHLGGLGKIGIIVHSIYYLGKIFYFLRPSFYLVALG